MKLVRLLILTGFAMVALSWFSHTKSREKNIAPDELKKETYRRVKNNTPEKLEQKAAAAKQFVHRNGYNKNTCFFIDMSLPSGQNRFFIYDLMKDTLRASGLVAHGNCYGYSPEGSRYSNVVGSGCTSLGKYRIGNHYTGKFGYSYKLLGLDSTNNNAFERTVVLHAHSCVPESEVPDEICPSNGCPMTSPGFFKQLKFIINHSAKPVLLWIYE